MNSRRDISVCLRQVSDLEGVGSPLDSAVVGYMSTCPRRAGPPAAVFRDLRSPGLAVNLGTAGRRSRRPEGRLVVRQRGRLGGHARAHGSGVAGDAARGRHFHLVNVEVMGGFVVGAGRRVFAAVLAREVGRVRLRPGAGARVSDRRVESRVSLRGVVRDVGQP